MENRTILEFKNIQKRFAENVVLSGVNFSVREGEIVALAGENGAGKSTLMNILFGMNVIHSTGGFEGEIYFEGKPVKIQSPKEAMAIGIGMVHQEFMLLPGFSIARNIKLNRENLKPTLLGRFFGKSLDLLDSKAIVKDASMSLDRLGLALDPEQKVGTLPVGHKQFVEIAREIDKSELKLLVLDEPTAVLTESEADTFLECIRKIAEKGISVIFITHRLDEIIKITDRVVVLRDGHMISDMRTSETTKQIIAEQMVGRELDLELSQNSKEKKLTGDPVLRIRDLKVDMPGERCENISLDVYPGEILGIGGLAGHGKTAVSNAIMGLYPAEGTIEYEGTPLHYERTGEAMKQGIAFVSEDRKGVGLLLNESIMMNVVFADMRLHRNCMKKIGFFTQFDRKAALNCTEKYIKELDVRCSSPDQPVGSLSGGNQQKVCMARALAMSPKLLLVSEPTRGIDIGAKQLLLERIKQLNREHGLTIIMTSSELNELRSVCDRIAIVANGQVAGILRPDAANVDFALLMSGEKLERGEAE